MKILDIEFTGKRFTATLSSNEVVKYLNQHPNITPYYQMIRYAENIFPEDLNGKFSKCTCSNITFNACIKRYTATFKFQECFMLDQLKNIPVTLDI